MSNPYPIDFFYKKKSIKFFKVAQNHGSTTFGENIFLRLNFLRFFSLHHMSWRHHLEKIERKRIEWKNVFLKFPKNYSESIPHVSPDDFFWNSHLNYWIWTGHTQSWEASMSLIKAFIRRLCPALKHNIEVWSIRSCYVLEYSRRTHGDHSTLMIMNLILEKYNNISVLLTTLQ